jgi:ribose transport system substrate-binding protein
MKLVAGTRDPYLIEAAASVLDVLDLFRSGREQITLTDVVKRTGMVKSTAFRVLYTLEKKGYIERLAGARAYSVRRRHRVGFASISCTIPFAIEINRGIAEAAEKARVDLMVAYNDFDPRKIVRNVEDFLIAGVDLIVEYNTDEHLSHVIADLCSRANVPVVAITFPVPGATTLGINNYRAGLTGGEGIGQHIANTWQSRLDQIVLLDLLGNSPTQQARMTGMLDGVRKFVRADESEIMHLHASRPKANARQLIRSLLNRQQGARRILILSFNDDNALSALRAVEEAGRSKHALILSQGAVTAVRQELRRPGSPLWGAIAHFPERFGAALMPVVTRILRGDRVPNSVPVEHVLLTRSNVGQYYSAEETEPEHRTARDKR